MDRKIMWVLNTLGLVALIVVLVLGFEIYQMLKPQPQLTRQEILKTEEILDEFWKKRSLVLPDQKRERIQQKVENVETSAVIEVIQNHIEKTMVPSIQGFNNLDRKEYARAIAEALVKYTTCDADAMWLCGMAQTESSYRIWARPPASTNSSARGILQVIYKYHTDILAPIGVTKENMGTDVDRSVQGGVKVFYRYLYDRKGNKRSYREATKRYRSLAIGNEEQLRYYQKIATVFNQLQKNLKELKSV